MGVLIRRASSDNQASWTWWETGALALYTGVVAAGIRWHEGWTDEAQAWMIARDSGWWQMMSHGIGYEGSPGLWHSILWFLAKLHISYIGMHYAVALLAVFGAWVFLRFAPFPRYLKLLIPFTFFLAYQDAVVARSYVLFASLGFGAAAILRQREPRPVLLATLLGLMANMSAHGCVASAGLAVVAFIQSRRSGLDRTRRYQFAALLLVFFWLVAVASAIPPRDTNFAAAKTFHKTRIPVVDSTGTHWVYGNDQIPVAADPDVPHVVTLKESHMSLTMQGGELAPIPLVRAHLPLGRRLWLHIAHFLGLITFPISTSRSMALVAATLLFAVAVSRKRGSVEADPPAGLGLIGLIPYVLMIVAFCKLYIAPRHAGILFSVFLISVWLVWPGGKLKDDPIQRRQWLRVAFTTVLILIAIQQIGWTKDAIVADEHYPYSGDWTTASFLKSARMLGPVAGFYYHASGALAYLPGYKYMNQPNSYWLWSSRLRIDQEAPKTLAQHPAYVVVGGFEWGDQGDVAVDWANPYEGFPYMPYADSYRIVSYFEHHGYIESHRLCGRLLMRDGYSEQVCNIILEPYVPED